MTQIVDRNQNIGSTGQTPKPNLTKEQDNTSTARIKPPKQVEQPVYIKFEELEAFREIIEIKKQRSDR